MGRMALILLLAGVACLCGLGCGSRSATGAGGDAGVDSIASYRKVRDTVVVDASLGFADYPRAARTSDSSFLVEHLVQVSCGFARFSVDTRRDTLVVYAIPPSGGACVDWTAEFYYRAEIVVRGRCGFVKFIGNQRFLNGKSDKVVAFP